MGFRTRSRPRALDGGKSRARYRIITAPSRRTNRDGRTNRLIAFRCSTIRRYCKRRYAPRNVVTDKKVGYRLLLPKTRRRPASRRRAQVEIGLRLNRAAARRVRTVNSADDDDVSKMLPGRLETRMGINIFSTQYHNSSIRFDRPI